MILFAFFCNAINGFRVVTLVLPQMVAPYIRKGFIREKYFCFKVVSET